jgi:hypothetical protein
LALALCARSQGDPTLGRKSAQRRGPDREYPHDGHPVVVGLNARLGVGTSCRVDGRLYSRKRNRRLADSIELEN